MLQFNRLTLLNLKRCMESDFSISLRSGTLTLGTTGTRSPSASMKETSSFRIACSLLKSQALTLLT